MLKRKDKEKIVKRLEDELKKVKLVVFTDYKGVTASSINELRKELFKEDASYEVLKKNLIQIALDNAKVKADVKSYKRPLALAISSSDEVAPAKIIASFSKKQEEDVLKMIGGVLEGKYLSEEEINALAELPGKEELIAKAVGSIKAPINNLAGVLSGVTRQLVYVLKATAEKKA